MLHDHESIFSCMKIISSPSFELSHGISLGLLTSKSPKTEAVVQVVLSLSKLSWSVLYHWKVHLFDLCSAMH